MGPGGQGHQPPHPPQAEAVKLVGENTFEAIYEKWLAHRELGLKKGRQTPLPDLDVVALPLPPANHNPFLRWGLLFQLD